MAATAFLRQGGRGRRGAPPRSQLEFMQTARRVWVCAQCLLQYRMRCTACGAEPERFVKNVCPACGGELRGKAKKHRPICDARGGCGGKAFIHFPSSGECRRFLQLRMLEESGVVEDLKLRTRFPLDVVRPDGTAVTVGHYECDFDYVRDGQRVVEDFKGASVDEAATRLFAWKRAHLEAQHGLTLTIYAER